MKLEKNGQISTEKESFRTERNHQQDKAGDYLKRAAPLPATLTPQAIQEHSTPHTGEARQHINTELEEARSRQNAATITTELQRQQTAELERNQQVQQDLRSQLNKLQMQYDTALEQNRQLSTEKDGVEEKLTLLQQQLVATVERSRQIDKDNEQKSILYAAALERIHQQEKDNQLLKAKINAAEEHNRTVATTQTDNQDLRRQVADLHNQHRAEIQRYTTEKQALQTPLEDLKRQHTTALEQIIAEKHHIQQEVTLTHKQHAVAVEEAKQIVAAAQAEKQHLQREHEHLQIDRQRKTQFVNIATQRIKLLRNIISELRQGTAETLKTFQEEIGIYKTQIHTLAAKEYTNPNRVMELSKIEAFDLWIQQQPNTETQISAQTLLHRVTSKLNHTFKSLKAELYHTTQERDKLQTKIEQQQEENPAELQAEELLEDDKIKHSGNLIVVTMKNLPPPINIFQYYEAYKPMILKNSNLPDIRNKSHISQEQFQLLWKQADSAAKDLLIFMWVLKDLIISKAVVEITTANPPFFLTRFCISAIVHISKHHDAFYTNVTNRNSLPPLDPYEPALIREIQEAANAQYPDFLSALDILAAEDSTILHEATQYHQNLSRKFPDSFPQAFHRIQLHGYITRALEDRKITLEHRQISTPHARTLLYLPQYDPGTMKIPKRS
jgi:hypothetical protein